MSKRRNHAEAWVRLYWAKRRLIVAWENQRAVMEDCAEAMKRFKVAVREMQMRTGWRPGPEGE